jgi:hypothetical protein
MSLSWASAVPILTVGFRKSTATTCTDNGPSCVSIEYSPYSTPGATSAVVTASVTILGKGGDGCGASGSSEAKMSD